MGHDAAWETPVLLTLASAAEAAGGGTHSQDEQLDSYLRTSL